MPPKYKIGQKITIKPIDEQSLSARNSNLRRYAGLTGEIVNYYWIGPPTGELFYLYKVRIGTSTEEIVLYDDEIECMPSRKVQPS